MTYADVMRPTQRRYALLYDLACIAGGSLFITLAAQIVLPLPFSPVPISGQTLAVLLVGTLLGSRRGSLAVLTYLVEGVLGLPVFAGGMAGPARLAGPTGGYLLGFAAAAFLVGRLAEKNWDRHLWTAGLAMLLGNAVIYALGLPWLAYFVGSERALATGLLPFIFGDLLKLILSATLLPVGWRLLGRLTG